jgi:hypothetical protein
MWGYGTWADGGHGCHDLTPKEARQRAGLQAFFREIRMEPGGASGVEAHRIAAIAAIAGD